MSSISVSITTPRRPIWEGTVEELILSTDTGEVGILKNHACFFTGLDVGRVQLLTKDGWYAYALMGGYAFLDQDDIIIVAHDAVTPEEVDPDEVKEAFERAKNEFEKNNGAGAENPAVELSDPFMSPKMVEANYEYKRTKACYEMAQVVYKM